MFGSEIDKVLVSEEQIRERCKELGAELTKAYEQEADKLLVVALLKGSVPFLSELIKRIELPLEIDFMDVSSYDGTESIGDIKIIKDLDCSVKGMDILLVEDIIDTGRTVYEVKKLLYNKGAQRVRVVSLLDKPERRVVNIEADYVGYVVPNEFVVGFGLDYNQKYRNLPYIGVLKPEVYQ
ncbi:MAG: hypoxanthine phosphoribosyltransferase [Erysipelotrichaceae bacterium]|nr:hypoxanthine phosphoribosyltransferase [Erysipelotrichaceae bacterium]